MSVRNILKRVLLYTLLVFMFLLSWAGWYVFFSAETFIQLIQGVASAAVGLYGFSEALDAIRTMRITEKIERF